MALDGEVNAGDDVDAGISPGSTLPAEHFVCPASGRGAGSWSTPGQRSTGVPLNVAYAARGMANAHAYGDLGTTVAFWPMKETELPV